MAKDKRHSKGHWSKQMSLAVVSGKVAQSGVVVDGAGRRTRFLVRLPCRPEVGNPLPGVSSEKQLYWQG